MLKCDLEHGMARLFLDCNGHFYIHLSQLKHKTMIIREISDIWRQFSMISISSLQFYVMNSHWDVPCGAYIETGHSPSVLLVVLNGTEGTPLAFRSVRLHLLL